MMILTIHLGFNLYNMIKEELINFIKSRVFSNAQKLISGDKNQEALLAIVDDCYNDPRIQEQIDMLTLGMSNLNFSTNYLENRIAEAFNALRMDVNPVESPVEQMLQEKHYGRTVFTQTYKIESTDDQFTLGLNLLNENIMDIWVDVANSWVRDLNTYNQVRPLANGMSDIVITREPNLGIILTLTKSYPYPCTGFVRIKYTKTI